MNKKILSMAAAAAMSAAAVCPVMAAESKTPKIIVDERELSFDDQGPVIMEETGRTLIPLRFVLESAGAKVQWDGEKKTVTVDSGDNRNRVILTIGSDEMEMYYYPSVKDYVTETKKLDQMPVIMNDRTMIPVRAVLEAIGAKVDWDENDYVINVTSRAYSRYLRDMGVEGAALASDFSMFVSCVWTFICARHILKQKTQARMYFFPPALKKYLTLAIPSIIQSSVLSIGTMALQVIVNKAGIAYINGYTAANTIFNLFLLPIVAISTGFETFASQNIGASITERVRGGYHFLMKEGVLICVALSVLDVLLAGKFISIYATYPGTESFSFARVYLYLMIPNFFLQLFKYSIESLFKAHLKMNLFAASSILSLSCRIAFAFIFTSMIGLSAMAWALLFGSLVSVIFDMCWKHYLKL